MTAFVEWAEPLNGDADGTVLCRVSFRDIVRVHFKQHPEAVSASEAIDNFIITNWGYIVRFPHTKESLT